MALLVTASLERHLAQIAGLTDIVSTSGPGTVAHHPAIQPRPQHRRRGAGRAGGDQRGQGTLPGNLPYPPTYAKVNPADPPIITFALTSDTLPIFRLSDAADTLLAQRLSQVTGVGRVLVQGTMRPAVRVQADPVRLAAYGLVAGRRAHRHRRGQRQHAEGQRRRAAPGVVHHGERPAEGPGRFRR